MGINQNKIKLSICFGILKSKNFIFKYIFGIHKILKLKQLHEILHVRAILWIDFIIHLTFLKNRAISARNAIENTVRLVI